MLVSYDPSFDGLLSAIAWCLRRREHDPYLIPEGVQISLAASGTIPVEANIRRLFGRHFSRQLGQAAARNVLDQAYRAFLSEDEQMGTAIYRYFALALRQGQDPSGMIQHASVATVTAAAARVSGQAHQYLGLLRFRMLDDGLYLAEFEPDYHVMPLVVPHFMDRLSDMPFVISDKRRRLAAWYRPGRGCALYPICDDTGTGDRVRILPGNRAEGSEEMAALPGGEPPGMVSMAGGRQSGAFCDDSDAGLQTDRAEAFEALWQRYLDRLTIPERRNRALQQANMPRKYWKYLVEQPGQTGLP